YIARRDALLERNPQILLPFHRWLARLCRWQVVTRLRKLHHTPGITASSEGELRAAELKSASITLAYERIARSQDERTRRAIADPALGHRTEAQCGALRIFHEETAPAVPRGAKHEQIRAAYRRVRTSLGLSTEEEARELVRVAHLRARRWVIRL